MEVLLISFAGSNNPMVYVIILQFQWVDNERTIKSQLGKGTEISPSP